jgi:hypothetical protein
LTGEILSRWLHETTCNRVSGSIYLPLWISKPSFGVSFFSSNVYTVSVGLTSLHLNHERDKFIIECK